MDPSIQVSLDAAVAAAQRFRGSTSPNPPVGACALDREGTILGVRAHERAGEPHAEALLLQDLARDPRLLARLDTLVVTLEPCNHAGRTPPCTQAIFQARTQGAPLRRIVFGTADPNPSVAGGGAATLRSQGFEVSNLEDSRCRTLIAPFAKRVLRGLPWVTLKIALNAQGSMIPPQGQKTFTQPDSLRLAHELRKRSDAILTGSGTILADHPLFTVREVPDFAGKRRPVVVLDRRGRLAQSDHAAAWIAQYRIESDLEMALRNLASQGANEVLVEAGPTLSAVVNESPFWDEKVVIQQTKEGPDQITIETHSQ